MGSTQFNMMATTKTKPKKAVKSRTTGEPLPLRLEWIDLADLADNPLNWRTHPPAQLKALDDAIAEVGWAGVALYNERTGRLIDGHARKEVRAGKGKSPVLIGSWDEATERKILATLDPLAAMADADKPKLDELLRGVDTGSEALQEMLAGVADVAKLCDAAKEEETDPAPEFKGVWGLMESIRFPSSNKWELPDLREDMLSDQAPSTIYDGVDCADASQTMFIFGTAKFQKEKHAGGALAFYIDDARFESVWSDAVRHVADWVRFGWSAVVSPDFSLWRDDPLAVQMWAMFRSRWLARYWQEVGIRLIPSLNWSDERTHEWAFAGIPRGAPVVSLQCRTVRTKEELKFFGKGITAAMKELAPQKVLVYGGNTNRETIEPMCPDGPEYIWLDDWTAVRRKRMAMKKNDANPVGCGGGGGGGGGRGGNKRAGGGIIGPA